MSARKEFDDLLAKRLIPEFCSDLSRRMDPSGFSAKSNRVTEEDAEDFLRAWNAGLPVHQGRGQYLVGTGRVREQFFWSGATAAERRMFTLWLEPVITMGAIARLNLDHGWPVSRVSAQSRDWAFDIVAMASDGASEAISGEVKKSRAEVDDLVDLMAKFGTEPDATEPATGKARNAFKKMASLRRGRAPILWLVGPARYEKVIEVKYFDNGVVKFNYSDTSVLLFSAARRH